MLLDHPALHVGLLAGTVVLTVGLAGVAWYNRSVPGAQAFAALTAMFAVYVGSHALGLLTSAMGPRLVLERLQWVGLAFIPVAWLAFAMRYTGYDRRLGPRTVVALSVVPTVTAVLALTSTHHGLLFVESRPINVRGLIILEQTFGPWFWAYVAYAYTLLGAGTLLILRLVAVSDYLYATQSALLAVGVTMPWLANAVSTFRLTPVVDPRLDVTPYAFAVTALAFGSATFRGRLLELVPAARQVGRQAAVRGLDDGVLILDAARRVIYCNPAAADVLGREADAALGTRVDDLLPAGVLDLQAPDGLGEFAMETATYEVRTSKVTDHQGRLIGHTVVLHDVTGRKERERQLRRSRDRLEELDALNRLLRGVNRALVDATTVADIERAVADHLSDSRLYETVRVETSTQEATVAIDGDETDDATATQPTAPPDEAVSSAVRADGKGDRGLVLEGSHPRLPVGRPGAGSESGPGTDATDPGDDGSGGEIVLGRDDDLPPGGRWIVVPVSYGRTTDGMVALYSTREDAFDDRERAVVAELGRTVGHAVNAVRSRRLLVAEAAVELELTAPAPEVGVDLAAATAPVELTGVVPAEGAPLVHLRPDDDTAAAAETLCEAVRSHEGAADPTTIDDHRVELALIGPSVLVPLVEYGASVREYRADADQARVVAELAPGTEVRPLIEAIERAVPGAQLVARRERDRDGSDRGGPARPESITDRQFEVLNAAYRAGYFEWPRGSTAEEVADALGVAAPTLHEHLRTAHRKLLDDLFEEAETDDDHAIDAERPSERD